MRPLNLILKKEYFLAILNGDKKIEYREYKKYWNRILDKNEFTFVCFKNGYNKNAPSMLFSIVKINTIKTPLFLKTIITTEYCYEIILGKIIKTENIRFDKGLFDKYI